MEPPRPLCHDGRVRAQRAPSFSPGSRRCSRGPFLSSRKHPPKQPARPRAERAADSLTNCQDYISPATAWQGFAAAPQGRFSGFWFSRVV